MHDYTLYPLLRPGSFVQIDPRMRRIQPSRWRTEFDRPIYFLELRNGYACGWCEVQGNELALLPHPLSPCNDAAICVSGRCGDCGAGDGDRDAVGGDAGRCGDGDFEDVSEAVGFAFVDGDGIACFCCGDRALVSASVLRSFASLRMTTLVLIGARFGTQEIVILRTSGAAVLHPG